MTGQEEQVGGFDLICKGTPIKNESTLFSTMLGCYNNRSHQLKKLAKIISTKLQQNFNQEKEDAKKKVGGGRDNLSSASTSDAASTKGKTKATSKVTINNANPIPSQNVSQTASTNSQPTTNYPSSTNTLNSTNSTINKATPVNKAPIAKQPTNTFQQQPPKQPDPKIMKPTTTSTINKPREIPKGNTKPNTLPPVGNATSTSGSLQSNLLQKNSSPGISSTTGGYSSGNPMVSSPGVGSRQLKDQNSSSIRSTLTNSPGINTGKIMKMSNVLGMKGRALNTQNLLEQNAEIYNYDIDKPPTYNKVEKQDSRQLDDSATINYDNKNHASRDGSEEGKMRSYGHMSNNEEDE